MPRSCPDKLSSALCSRTIVRTTLLPGLVAAAMGSFALGCETTTTPPGGTVMNPVLPRGGTGAAGTLAPSAGGAGASAMPPRAGVGGMPPVTQPPGGVGGATAGASAAGAGGMPAGGGGAGASAAGAPGAGTGGASAGGAPAAGAGGAMATGPSFTALYNKELGACQNPSCHNSDDPKVRLSVDMRTRDSAYASLVGKEASATGNCAGKGVLVTPNDPSKSLMYLKMNIEGAPRPPCGGPMPPGGTFSVEMGDAVKAWIMAGAPNN